ncbi:hypothetical protein LG047_19485 [Methylocystis sp. WRRC1]|jgi:hypothetical protein|uniref:hypothetical protein n=1 Tax=Methylocystis sp. WRRC1 TaxID=1732014 RepID=UPI001D158650|nr:hypothetical protein [Methylocystis sp. WRRC1]MCC3247474.1 hypothetical protein [Methylocystis sp. WRRC1]
MSSRIHFLGDDPQQAVDRARSLADDLARIASGDGPTPDDLAAAPILDCSAAPSSGIRGSASVR